MVSETPRPSLLDLVPEHERAFVRRKQGATSDVVMFIIFVYILSCYLELLHFKVQVK